MSAGWVRIPSTWTDDVDIEALGSDAAMLHLSALAFSCRQLTDGHVPAKRVPRLWPVDDVDECVRLLVESGLWETTEDGYFLATWADHLMPSDEVEKRRRASAESSRRYRLHRDGDHSMCDRCAFVRTQGDGSRDQPRDASRDTSVTSPGTARHGTERSGVQGQSRAGHPEAAGSAGAPPTATGLPRERDTPPAPTTARGGLIVIDHRKEILP